MKWKDFFSYFLPAEDVSNPTKRSPRRPAARDWTDQLNCNYELTYGLYHNSYPGFKLAGGLAYAPIAVPISFMGLPIPKVDNDDQTQEILNSLVDEFRDDMQHIHLQSHRDGTCWIWPHYSSKTKELIWEFIPDHTITDIVRDLNTGKIIQLITDEEIHIITGYNQEAYIRRKRTFEERTVSVEWMSGKSSVPGKLLDKTMVNPAGILPVPFANNSEGEQVRGHSDYERILSYLKDYHDVSLKESSALAKFNPKLLLGVKDVDEWKKNNEVTDLSTIDIEKQDLFFYLKDLEDKPEMLFPQNISQAYESKTKRIFLNILEAAAIPELCWGNKVTGNIGSFEQQMDGLVKYVEQKRSQHVESYQKLFNASLALLNIARMRDTQEKITIEWNKLDAISEKTKSEIFHNFAQGIAAIIESAGGTKEQLYNIWKKMYPSATTEDYDAFVLGLSEMGSHNQWRNANYIDTLDLSGDESSPPPTNQE
jgi:hypothetical protein